LLNYEIIKL